MYMYGSICSTFRYLCSVIGAPTLKTHSSQCASHVILNNNNVYHSSKIQNGSQTRQYQLENLSGVWNRRLFKRSMLREMGQLTHIFLFPKQNSGKGIVWWFLRQFSRSDRSSHRRKITTVIDLACFSVLILFTLSIVVLVVVTIKEGATTHLAAKDKAVEGIAASFIGKSISNFVRFLAQALWSYVLTPKEDISPKYMY